MQKMRLAGAGSCVCCIQIVDTFARDCFTGFDILCAEPGNYRFCIGDEHYISTLLAVQSRYSHYTSLDP